FHAVEREGGHLDVEMFAARAHHAIAADHKARRSLQRYAAGVFEGVAGLEHRLFADNAGPAYLLAPAVGVRDAPMAGLQLYRLGAVIGDGDRIGPEEIIALRRRPVGDETRRHHDLDIVGHRTIHDAVPAARSGCAFPGMRRHEAVTIAAPVVAI